MALSQTLKDQIDPILDDLVTDLASIQSTYKTANDKYWQGVPCVSITPADGNEESTDLTVKPTDQDENWNDEAISLASTLPVHLQVDSYDGPQGFGYVVIGIVIEATRTYRRSVNVGPETYRNQNWTDVTLEE